MVAPCSIRERECVVRPSGVIGRARHSARADLSAELTCRAILASQGLAAGCKLAIGSDAHAPEHFDFLRLGILTARRGWAGPGDILNVSPAKQAGKH